MNAVRIESRRARLKDGSAVTVRHVEISDAAPVAELLREVHAAGLGVMKFDDEAPLTTKEMRRNLERWIEGEFSHFGSAYFVAERDGRVLGEVNARRHSLRRLSHSARLGISVRPDAQRLGVGRALVQTVFEWARETQRRATDDDPGVRRIELSVIGDNSRAIRLYESLGFSLEGRCRGKVRELDGTLRDDLDMALWIDLEVGTSEPAN